MRKSMYVLAAAAAFVALAAVGCGAGDAGDSGWAGTVRDSAGIAIIENPGEGLWTPEQRWTVREDLRIGTATGAPEYQFGMITDLAVDSAGRMYVMDTQAQTVRVYDSEGAFLHTIGSPGQGPGELAAGVRWILLGSGDTLYVPSTRQQRVQRYLEDGTPAGTFPISIAQGIPLVWVAGPNGVLVSQVRRLNFPGAGTGSAQSSPDGDLLLARAGDGTILDTLAILPRGETFSFSGGMSFNFFSPEPVWALADDGSIISAVNSSYRIEIRSRSGELKQIISKSFQRQPVTDSERRMLINAVRQAFVNQGMPPAAMDRINIDFADYYPAFARILAGPAGTIWVQHMRSADELEADMLTNQNLGAPRWDVFGANGRYLGVVETPDGFQSLEVEAGHLYGVWHGQLGVPYVLRLEIVRPGHAASA